MKKKYLGVFPALALGLLCCTGFVQAESYPAMQQALDALETDNAVIVTQQEISPWRRPLYVFEPKDGTPEKGFIFYPGGFVDPAAYAPAMRSLAELGYLAAIVPMPFDLAAFGALRATKVIQSFPTITTWAIGGHSLGGVMACKYAKRDFRKNIKGVVLWAAYPSMLFSLAGKDIQALSIYGSNDGLTTLPDIQSSRADLPTGTVFIEIEGGNHTQFGYYGDGEELQKGDNEAAISRELQTQRIVDATAAFLEDL